ncbi:MAG TPA: hypothetical protein VHJ83_05525, partial [Micromonosporaceae bacterium]|nr:hypothetical protein [Micromonosporaceae bacterium]
MADSLHHSILVLDIERFGRRSDVDQQWLRAQLHELLTRVLAESNVSRQDLRWQDRGDGGFFLISARVPKRLLIEPMVSRLHAALREHNTRASDVGRM